MVVGDTVALQCKALGSPQPRITWLRNDQPLRPSERYHFTAGNQLLIIGAASMEDAGRYTCLMSNTLGTVRAHSELVVTQSRNVCAAPSGPSTVTIGIIVIAVVTSIVVTSLVWVCIIYQTRKKSEECSVTNTGEPNQTVYLFLICQSTQTDYYTVHTTLMKPVGDTLLHPGGGGSYFGSYSTKYSLKPASIQSQAISRQGQNGRSKMVQPTMNGTQNLLISFWKLFYKLVLHQQPTS